MAKITLTIFSADNDETEDLTDSWESSMLVADLTLEAMEKLGFKAGPFFRYDLVNATKDEGGPLRSDQTLDEAGVKDGDELEFVEGLDAA